MSVHTVQIKKIVVGNECLPGLEVNFYKAGRFVASIDYLETDLEAMTIRILDWFKTGLIEW